MKRATSLTLHSFSYFEGKFEFDFLIDEKHHVINLEHSQKPILFLEDIRHSAFNLAMCYLLDIAEIVLPKEIVINADISDGQLIFWKNLFKDVAREKMFALKLDLELLELPWRITSTGHKFSHITSGEKSDGYAICLTGGKESLALLKLLKDEKSKITLFYLNLEKSIHRQKVFQKFEGVYPSIRTFSNRYQVINPLKVEYSDIFSGVDMAHLVFNTLLFSNSFNTVLIGNEYSSNFPNDIYQGYPINHQFVKSLDFAIRLNNYLKEFVTDNYTYQSPFFGLYEYRISDILFQNDDYLDVWTSCNRSTAERNFCSNCSKCAFTYLVSRVRRDDAFLKHFFSHDILDNLEIFKPIMDFVGEKPLDCVGDRKEVWVALNELRLKNIKGAVIDHFLNNIYPHIEANLNDYKSEVLSIQKVPIDSSKRWENIVTAALNNS
jgi:hypothetical protein